MNIKLNKLINYNFPNDALFCKLCKLKIKFFFSIFDLNLKC